MTTLLLAGNLFEPISPTQFGHLQLVHSTNS